MNDYTIDKGVPIPPMKGPGGAKGKAGRKRGSRFPIADLNPHDSFLVSDTERAGASSYACVYKQRNPGWDYTTRREGDGYRLWRVK